MAMTGSTSKTLYTAQASVEGGRGHGHGRSSDGELEVDLRAPKELGGEGGGTNPEQLFAVGFASCFGSALALVGQRKKAEAGDARIESKVMMLANENRGFDLAVELDVTMPSVDDAEVAADLLRTAHKVCPYSNATRGNIDVKLTANGTAVDL
jgi:osmotically inducible protein OsmC